MANKENYAFLKNKTKVLIRVAEGVSVEYFEV